MDFLFEPKPYRTCENPNPLKLDIDRRASSLIGRFTKDRKVIRRFTEDKEVDVHQVFDKCVVAALDETFVTSQNKRPRVEAALIHSAPNCPSNPIQRIDSNVLEMNHTDILGSGGFGRVISGKYKSHDQDLEVAIKFNKTISEKKSYKAKLSIEHEANILKDLMAVDPLDQAPIVRFIATENLSDEISILVLKKYNGNLNAYIKHKEYLDFSSVQNFTRQLVQGLSFLKENLIVHNDLKPGNILIDCAENFFFPTLRITDFGLAKKLSSPEEKFISSGGTICYLSPEAVFKVESSFERDAFSLGSIIFELITKKQLFKCKNREELKDLIFFLCGPLPNALQEKYELPEDLVEATDFGFCLSKPFSELGVAVKTENHKQKMASKICQYFRDPKVTMIIEPSTLSKKYIDTIDFINALICWDPQKRTISQTILDLPFLST